MITHVEIDPFHVDNDRCTGCIPEQSCPPQRHWCGPALHQATMLFEIDEYETGGVNLAAKDIGFYSIWYVTQALSHTPYLESLDDTEQHLCYGITVDTTDKCNIKIKLCEPGGEVADGTVINKQFWLKIYGTR